MFCYVVLLRLLRCCLPERIKSHENICFNEEEFGGMRSVPFLSDYMNSNNSNNSLWILLLMSFLFSMYVLSAPILPL